MVIEQEQGTRRKIMELAQELLRERGYNGFSYSHISEQLGVKNAAVHYYFPGKEDLGVALVERERRRFGILTAGKALQEMGPAEKLDWFFAVYDEYSHQGTRVCYLGALESSFGDLPEQIRHQARALHTEMLAWLASVLKEGRARNIFAFRGEPADKAVVILGAMQGAIQIARIGSPKQLYAAVRQIKQDLGLQS
jgi:AcrR family transcriptional regulator